MIAGGQSSVPHTVWDQRVERVPLCTWSRDASFSAAGGTPRVTRQRRAADVDPVKARVMFAVQQPLSASALGDVMGVPAWKALPSWFLVADGGQTIPPDAERVFAKRMGATTVEITSNHVAMVSHPDEVLQLIETAAQAVQASA